MVIKAGARLPYFPRRHSMVDTFIAGAIIDSNILALLALGFTLEYVTIGVPNFAHATIAFVSSYVTLTLTLAGMSPYAALPVAFILSSLLNLGLYELFAFLKNRKIPLVGLMVATLAIESVIYAFMNIYSDYLAYAFKRVARSFILRNNDFVFMGFPGVLLISSIACIGSIVGFYLLLTRTKFGIAMRAIVENYALADVQGINTGLTLSVAWFLVGGLIGVSGAIFPLWFTMDPMAGTYMIVRVLAACVLGGLSNVYAAWFGGFAIAGLEVLAIYAIGLLVGSWIVPFRLLIPISVLLLMLALMPEGIAGAAGRLRRW
jgi:branched-chain amino acid transport system permease protein